ncbi:MAG: hypothetical protein HC927_08425 [Deltaproteobacteria bacterium]|nr:hypothetical protein [Deltaproteobacteria bacterium]
MTIPSLRPTTLVFACSLALLGACNDPGEGDDELAETGETGEGEDETEAEGDDQPAPMCGDGVVDPGEDCDGELTLACADHDPIYLTGAVACSSECRFDTSACVSGPALIEVCSSPGLTINDDSHPSDTIVLDVVGTVVDVDVQLSVTHDHLEDLHVTLGHAELGPTLLNKFCGYYEDIDAVFDDEADIPLTCVPNPIVPDPPAAILGPMRPQDSFTVFDGLDAGGEWTLYISHASLFNGGTLDSWCLRVTVE